MTLWWCPNCSAQRGFMSAEWAFEVRRNRRMFRCGECNMLYYWDWAHYQDEFMYLDAHLARPGDPRGRA